MNYNITAGSIIVTADARYLVISALEQTEYKYITIGEGEWSLCELTFSTPQDLLLHLQKKSEVVRVISDEDVLPLIPWGDEEDKDHINPDQGPFLIRLKDKEHFIYFSECSGEEGYTDDIDQARLFIKYGEVPPLRRDEEVCFAPDHLPQRIVSIQGYSYIYNIETNATSIVFDKILSNISQTDTTYSDDDILTELIAHGFTAVKVEKYCPNPDQVIPFKW
ncbi:MAG: hypothetical protein ACE3L7_33470 [Candidatus Pristimantibacillus sp.]